MVSRARSDHFESISFYLTLGGFLTLEDQPSFSSRLFDLISSCLSRDSRVKGGVGGISWCIVNEFVSLRNGNTEQTLNPVK